MKFSQLKEYNMRNIFLKNHIQNVVEKLVPDFSINNQNEPISGSTVWGVVKFVFVVCPSRGLTKDITTTVLTTYLRLSYVKLFKKQK